MAGTRKDLVPILGVFESVPHELADRAWPDTRAKVFRAVMLPREAEPGDRVLRVVFGFPGRQVGVVVRRAKCSQGVMGAVLALYRGEDFGFDDSEIMVEIPKLAIHPNHPNPRAADWLDRLHDELDEP